MPTAKKTPTITVMDEKSLKLVKKARKLMRKLRKRAVKAKQTATLLHSERLIETYDTIIADQKVARNMAKSEGAK